MSWKEDISPPRRTNNQRDISPPRRKTNDISQTRKSNQGISPPRKRGNDMSPPRKKIELKQEPEKQTHGLFLAKGDRREISPPRKKKNDISPPRRKTNDISPPRKSNIKQEDISPPRKRARDISPPRKRSNSDISPPRKKANNDLSPPRGKANNNNNNNNNNDISPPRRKGNDISPPRGKSNQDISPPRRSNVKQEDTEKKQTHGLFVGQRGIEAEEKRRDAELALIRKADPRSLGMGAQTIYRDSKGRPLAMLNQMVAGPGFVGEESKMKWGLGEIDEQKQMKEDQLNEQEMGRGYHALYAEDLYADEELKEMPKQTINTNGTVDDFLESLPSDNRILTESFC